MNELISVIVPIYNVEKNLSRCIETIIKQTYYTKNRKLHSIINSDKIMVRYIPVTMNCISCD